ncbi:MAG: DUF2079 domain-containing protein [Chloroflexi bacterium]|nr:DUF2079 domain-containing protein [Chloroflexota bacterium]
MDDVFTLSILPEFVLILLAAALTGLAVSVIANRWSGPARIAAWLHAHPPLDRDLPWLTVGLFAFLYFSVYQTLSTAQHFALHTHAYDLGIFDQVVWNSSQGRLFANSIMSDSPSFLGHHLSFTLLAMVPFYWFWSDPRMLLAVQTVLIIATVVPIYFWALERLGRTGAVVVSACFFLYPALGFVNLFDFHEIVIAMPVLALGTYLMLKRQYLPFLLCLVVALLTKEEIAFVAVAYGLYIALAQRHWKLGLGVAAGGLAYGLAALLWIIPAFQGTDTYFFASRYGYLGDSISEMIVTLVTQPLLVLEHVFTVDKLGFVLRLLVPLALLPVVGWEATLLALPSLGYLLLSDDPNMVAIIYQYPAVLIPFLFFGAIEGARRVSQRWPVARVGVLTALLVAGLGSYVLHGGGPLSRNYQPERYDMAGRPGRGLAIMQHIPHQAAVSAQSDLVPHLSQRERVYLFPEIFDAEYVLLDTQGNTFPLYQPNSRRRYDEAVTRMRADPAWQLELEDDGFLLFHRRPFQVPNPVSFTLGDRIRLVGYQMQNRGDSLHLTLYWQASAPIDRRYTVLNHVTDKADPARIVGQQDNQPVGDALPTTAWEPGRLVADEYDIAIWPNTPPGEYVLRVGMYVAPDGPRLAATDSAGQSLGDSIPLTTVRVGP